MELSLIAAYDVNTRIIGNQGRLPWNLKKDLAWFKQKTLNKSVIMGRKTAQSLKGPLPNRNNIVISRNPTLVLNHGFKIASNFEEALFLANYTDNSVNPEVMIIGGENIYRQALSKVTSMYLTEVRGNFKGDAHFPLFDKTNFIEKSRQKNEENGIKFDFVTYVKR